MKKLLVVSFWILNIGSILRGMEKLPQQASLPKDIFRIITFGDAINKNDEFAVEQILRAIIDQKTREDFINQPLGRRGHRSWAALHIVSDKGYDSLAQKLLEFGANPNVTTNHLETPLMLASESGNTSIVEQLLKHKADPNWVASDYCSGETALFCACRQNSAVITHMLLKAGADIWARENNFAWTVLHIAALDEYESIIHVLLASFTNENLRISYVNARNSRGETALHEASDSGNCSVLKILLAAGADINATDNDNSTPLHNAARMCQKSAVTLLLEKGANPLIYSTRFREGTPLLVALHTFFGSGNSLDQDSIINLLIRHSMFKQKNCILCFEDFKLNDELVLLLCGHIAGHISCKAYSLEQCPFCRKIFTIRDTCDLKLTEDLLNFLKEEA